MSYEEKERQMNRASRQAYGGLAAIVSASVATGIGAGFGLDYVADNGLEMLGVENYDTTGNSIGFLGGLATGAGTFAGGGYAIVKGHEKRLEGISNGE